jgi:hypothetical protein
VGSAVKSCAVAVLTGLVQLLARHCLLLIMLFDLACLRDLSWSALAVPACVWNLPFSVFVVTDHEHARHELGSELSFSDTVRSPQCQWDQCMQTLALLLSCA